MTQQELHELVYNFKTKHKEGFTVKEMRKLVAENFPKVTKEKFAECLGTNTVRIIDGDMITYHTDVFYALLQIVEDRDLKWFEFD